MTRPAQPELDADPHQDKQDSAKEPIPEADQVAIRRVRSAPMATAGIIGAMVAAAVLFSSRDHWLFFFQSRTPKDLGAIEGALSGGHLRHNSYVSFTARPILESEGRYQAPDPQPGCLTGPVKDLFYTLVSETGDRVVLRTSKSLKAEQQIPKRERFAGRLLRMDRLEDAHRVYRRFLYRLTDCRTRPEDCNRQLLVAEDLPRGEFIRQIGRSGARIRGTKGLRIDLGHETPVFLIFHYPDEWEYEVTGGSKEQAVEQVKALGAPWIYLETRKEDHLFVIKPPRAVAERLTREQRRGKGYGISQRTASFLVTFGQLDRQGESLVIRRVGVGFPEEYVTAQAGGEGPPILQASTPSGLVRIPLSRFVKASYHGPRGLPEDAYLLVVDQRPGHAWGAMLVASVAALAVLGGIFFVVLGLRRPGRQMRS